MQELNVDNAGGEMRKIAMDGSGGMTVAGLDKGHHDFTVLPDGGIALCLWNTTGMDAHNSLVERSASGQMTTIIPDLNTIYNSRARSTPTPSTTTSRTTATRSPIAT